VVSESELNHAVFPDESSSDSSWFQLPRSFGAQLISFTIASTLNSPLVQQKLSTADNRIRMRSSAHVLYGVHCPYTPVSSEFLVIG
jgi:hypothetical protein